MNGDPGTMTDVTQPRLPIDIEGPDEVGIAQPAEPEAVPEHDLVGALEAVLLVVDAPVTEAVAAEMVGNAKADVVIAPGYDSAALSLFAAKRKNMRVLAAPAPGRLGAACVPRVQRGVTAALEQRYHSIAGLD